MRAADNDAYVLYRQIGATVLPYASIADIRADLFQSDDAYSDAPERLSGWFLKTRPSFSCFAYGASEEIERIEDDQNVWIPRFLYLRKYDRPPVDLEWRSGGSHYVMTVYWRS